VLTYYFLLCSNTVSVVSRPTAPIGGLSGSVYCLRVYDVALTSAQIMDVAKSCLNGSVSRHKLFTALKLFIDINLKQAFQRIILSDTFQRLLERRRSVGRKIHGNFTLKLQKINLFVRKNRKRFSIYAH